MNGLGIQESVIATVLCLVALVAKAALYESVLQTPQGPVQGYPAFNSSPANMNITYWKDVTVWKGIPFAADTSRENCFCPP